MKTWSGRAQVECSGKEQLAPAQAREVADRMRRRDKNKRVTAYHCSFCDCWHVGGSPNSRFQAKKAYKREKLSENQRVTGGLDGLENSGVSSRAKVFSVAKGSQK